MTNVIDAQLPLPLSTPSPARRDLSFNQRHAWLREYQHADQGSHDAAQAQARPKAEEEMSISADDPHKPAAEVELGTPLPRTVKPAAALAAHPSFHQTTAPDAGPMPAPAPFTPAAAWLHAPATLRPAQLPAAAATAVIARPRQPGEHEPAARKVTLFRDGDTLSLTVRDTTLAPGEALHLMHELNATGATRGMTRVNVTLNGRSVEQRTGHLPE